MARDFDRKALKDDAFQDTVFWVVDWVYQRRVWFISGAVIVLAVGGSVLGYVQWRKAVVREQTQHFYEAERTARDGTLGEDERVKQAREAFQAFVKDYPDSNLAPVAWMNVARLAWAEDDESTARHAYEAVLHHAAATSTQRALARIGLATLAEAKGQFDVSAEQFNAVEDTHFKELKALSLGRIAMARKQSQEARDHFEQAARADPGSTLAEWARQNLDYHP